MDSMITVNWIRMTLKNLKGISLLIMVVNNLPFNHSFGNNILKSFSFSKMMRRKIPKISFGFGHQTIGIHIITLGDHG